MMITAENITSHELIGLAVKIIESSNPQIVGLNGQIIDETKSMFTLNTKNGIKSIPKAKNSWRFTVNGSPVIVNGSNIQKRPFDRVGRRS